MTCKHNVPPQSLSGARSVVPQGCCPPADTSPPEDNETFPGEIITPGGDVPGGTQPPQPQPNPQPDPVVRIYRKRSVARRNLTQRYPTPSNRWRWTASNIDGNPPPSGGVNSGPYVPGVNTNPNIGWGIDIPVS